MTSFIQNKPSSKKRKHPDDDQDDGTSASSALDTTIVTEILARAKVSVPKRQGYYYRDSNTTNTTIGIKSMLHLHVHNVDTISFIQTQPSSKKTFRDGGDQDDGTCTAGSALDDADKV